jgi:hypothetical protein
MEFELTLLAVPALAVLVLGALLATAGRTIRSMCLNTLGVIGVLFGGPSAVLVLGAPPAERGEKVNARDNVEAREIEVATDAKASGVVDEVRPASDATIDGASPGSDAGPESAVRPSSAAGAGRIADGELYEPIAPGGVSFPDGRPSWVTIKRERHGQDVDREVVSSGPYANIQNCYDALDDELLASVNSYIDWQLERDGAAQFVGIDLRYVNRRLVRQRADYPMQSSVGLMQQSDALLEFDQSFRDDVKRRWNDAQQTSRLLLAGVFGAGAIGLLGLLFGFFRLDNATRGFYTGRLQFATVAGILGLVAAGVLLARWIPWL